MAKKTLKNIFYVDVVESDLKKVTLASYYLSSLRVFNETFHLEKVFSLFMLRSFFYWAQLVRR